MDNSAAVTGKGPQDQSVVDTATDLVPAVQSPAIEITKLTMDGATLVDGIKHPGRGNHQMEFCGHEQG